MQRFSFILTTCVVMFSVFTGTSHAQWNSQRKITQQMRLHNLAKPNPTLFVHFDKTIYSNNETVWFTAYLIKARSLDINKHQVLSLALVRDIDSAIIKHEKYAVSNGLSFGSLVLPDSLFAGRYHFLVSTNRVFKGVPEVIFVQPIILKTNLEPTFNASIKLISPGKPENNLVNQIVVSATTVDSRFLPKPIDVTYQYGNVIKKAKSNVSGELMFSVTEQHDLADPNVYAKVKYDNDSTYLNIAIPVTKRKAKVGFFPEGGTLVENVPSLVAWEVRDQQAAMVTLKATLYKNDKPIDTIETNRYGLGKFMLTPEKNSTYKVKLMHSAFGDSSYRLPVPVEQGAVISIKNAVAKDTLSVSFRNNKTQKVALRIHNFKESFIYYEVDLNTPRKSIKIPLNVVPQGINAITISDSLGRPLSERMFFAHADFQKKISIMTDKSSYTQRQKVKLSLKLVGKDTLGLVSVACVQDDRLSTQLTTDIESYSFLKNELNTLPVIPGVRGFGDPEYIEDVLLVKGWRRYTWKDIQKNISEKDTVAAYDSVAYSVSVEKSGSKLKKPVSVGFLKDNGAGFLSTSNSGELVFKNEDLLLQYGQKMRLFVNGKDQSDYSIKSHDPYLDLNKKYIKLYPVEFTAVPSAVQNNNVLALKGNEKAIQLKEVNITTTKDKQLKKKGSNPCGDYVCVNNILNCINHYGHPGNTQPIEDRLYKSGSGAMVAYKPCVVDGFITFIPGIYTKKEFYPNNYADPLEPAFVSTTYWNHAVLLNSNNKELEFYTSDIIGKFRIVVQGITGNNVLYEQSFFDVKAK